jgi:hypothetical protein
MLSVTSSNQHPYHLYTQKCYQTSQFIHHISLVEKRERDDESLRKNRFYNDQDNLLDHYKLQKMSPEKARYPAFSERNINSKVETTQKHGDDRHLRGLAK